MGFDPGSTPKERDSLLAWKNFRPGQIFEKIFYPFLKQYMKMCRESFLSCFSFCLILCFLRHFSSRYFMFVAECTKASLTLFCSQGQVQSVEDSSRLVYHFLYTISQNLLDSFNLVKTRLGIIVLTCI